MTVSGSSNNDSWVGLRPLGRRPLLWLSLFCVDAPLVALAWHVAFAHTFRTAVRPAECVALFLTAWSIYLTDRFVDSIAISPNGRRTARAQFCLSHRKPWGVAILIVTFIDGVIIVAAVPVPTIIRGIFFGVAALAYLAINFALSRWWRIVPIKELIVGFLFAAGSVLVPGAPPWSENLVVTATLFGCVCWLNCLSIAVWEREVDRDQYKHSFATSRSGAEIYVRIFGVALACAAAAFGFSNTAVRPLVACLLLSTALLLLLPHLRLASDERTASADLVLLTPLLLFLIERAR